VRSEKRYQVFVSSTYEDLVEERREVMQALLELDCIPAGMELLPAANEDQWSLIKRVIDASDYYLVIVAGRYGSLGLDGVGYTEKEYRYASQTGTPIITFLHKDPTKLSVAKCETTDAGRKRLDDFRETTKQKMVKYWSSAAELGSVVSRSIVVMMKNSPRVGWIRASEVPDHDVLQENVELNAKIRELERKLAGFIDEQAANLTELAQGSDFVKLDVTLVPFNPYSGSRQHRPITTTWDEIFAVIAPALIVEAGEDGCKSIIERGIFRAIDKVSGYDEENQFPFKELEIASDQIARVMFQFRALGLVEISTRKRAIHLRGAYWTTTSLGEKRAVQLTAIKKSPDPIKRSD
jgi:Domain of unknown function (DUF4062)